MASRHSSISHFGVLVAPHIPTVDTFSSHCFSISSALSMRWLLGFTLRHSPNNTFPFELFLPLTNRMRSCLTANAAMLGMRLATWRQMVSKLLKVAPGAICAFIYFIMSDLSYSIYLIHLQNLNTNLYL